MLARSRQLPGFIILIVGMAVGLLTFRSYGLSWDEPLFYDYAAALPYAYSPTAWLSGHFDLEQAFGSSASDHANRGPAYLLLASPVESLLERLGLDLADAWHLTNFIAFQLGVFLIFYQLCLRWMRPWPAAATTALLVTQPLLWGHAFINPKDVPFLLLFTAAFWAGIEYVDASVDPGTTRSRRVVLLLAASGVLGIATSVRVIAPLAGVLVVVYAAQVHVVARPRSALTRSLGPILAYAAIALLTTIVFWPYLWPAPLQRLVEVIKTMSSNPTQLAVLFRGQVWRAGALPRSYLPILLNVQLTEPVWPVLGAGLLVGIRRLWRSRPRTSLAEAGAPKQQVDLARQRPQPAEFLLAFAWFAVPVLHVLVVRPPMYDGFRHFLFILPPVFLIGGLALDAASSAIKRPWVSAGAVAVMLIPGLFAIARLHPYEYAYYNSFVGGPAGAFRSFETDYWLTCYKESLLTLDSTVTAREDVFVRREPMIATYYSGSKLTVRDYRTESANVVAGDYILVNTRSNEDLSTARDATVVFRVGRAGATFCVVKRVPQSEAE